MYSPDTSLNTLCQGVKKIHDSIHGYISLSNFALQIIDHKYFQRLRKLKQLGSCNYIFPNAVHTRFEHSIGTYYLAHELTKTIIAETNQKDIEDYLRTIPELQNYYSRTYNKGMVVFDSYIAELCKISALCHDIGHGPFSHIFDDVFLPKVLTSANHENASHENRSGIMLELIIKNNPILSSLIYDDEINFMKTLINPSNDHIGFLYQIVSNTLNGLDVDKYDYIVRDCNTIYNHSGIEFTRLIKDIKIIDNNIAYPEQSFQCIISLYQSRYRFHKEIYCHKGVISAQNIIIDILLELDPIINISNSINNMEEFCRLNDEYILECPQIINMLMTNNPIFLDKKQNILNALNLIKQLETHQLYCFIGSVTTDSHIDANIFFSDELDRKDIVVYQSKIGFVSGNKKNPLESIYVYKTKQSNFPNINGTSSTLQAIKKNIQDESLLISQTYQEYITMVFYKDKFNTLRINQLKSMFQKITN